jgi:branched-chain amino acid transport system permease protein
VPFGLPLSFDQWLYLLTLFTLVAAFVIASNLLRGRLGRATLAIRDHPLAAQAMGIDIVFTKAVIFGISAMLTGLAGALAVLAMRYVGPGMFGIFFSFGLLIGIAVGGIATLSGAIYGAIFLQLIFVVVGTSAQALQTWNTPVIYGLVLVVFLGFNPHGVAGLVDKTWRWLGQRRT